MDCYGDSELYLTSTPTCHDVLLFWKQNTELGMYPHLCQLAYLHLLGSASSVSVECIFSTTGLVTNNKRSSLSADKLHRMMTFIHDNLNSFSVET